MGCDYCIHEFVKAKEWQEGSLLHRFFCPYGNIGGTKQDHAFGKEKPLRVVLLLQELQKVPCKQSTHALYALGLDACLYMGK